MDSNETNKEELGGQMSFLDHLDEFRKRLVASVIIVVIAFLGCWFVSKPIYNFLAIPIQEAIAQQQNRQIPVKGLTGDEKILTLENLQENDTGLYIFDQDTKLGVSFIPKGASVQAKAARDGEGNLKLYTDEPIYTSNAIVTKGVELPADFKAQPGSSQAERGRLNVTTAVEPFTLYITVSLYAGIALSIPFLLWQIWGFISPALYRHERRYVTPFIGLSTISFVLGAAFAYYILFPPAVKYLLGIGADFSLMLRATDYFDFITLIMLAMGVIFQMPAITYVLARIGLVSAGFLVRIWKIALVVILIVAAVVSPTSDIPNMMLFAAPMILLYIISIFIAWFFGRKRQNDSDIENPSDLL
ncbi:MAG TPA: twin-arginine translocase subunit TatC [Pyrinomonadaceae bacterium]|jgi:sec-independent protein translocase protein TatC